MRSKFNNIVLGCLLLLLYSWAFWDINSTLYISAPLSILILGVKITKKKQITISIPDVIIVLYILYETYSFLLSDYKPNSIYFYVKILNISLLYFIIRNFIKRNMLFYILFFFSLYFMLINLLEILFFLIHYYRITYYGFTDLTQFRNLFMPFGKYSNEWVSNLFLMLLFPLSLYIYAIAIRKSSLSYYSKTLKLIKSNYFLLIMALITNIILFNILISFSRGAYIATGVCFFIIIIFFLIIKKTISWIAVLRYTAWILILPLVGIIILKQPVLSTVSLHSSVSHMRSTVGRVQLWENSFEIFKNSPCNGVGTNNFALNYYAFRNKGDNFNFTGKISNSYLQLLVEKGIIGFAVYLMLFFAFIYSLVNYSDRKTLLLEKIFLSISLCCTIAFMIREVTFSSFFFSDEILIQILIIYLLISLILFSNRPLCVLFVTIHAGIIAIMIVVFMFSFICKSLQSQGSYYMFKNDFDKKAFRSSLPLINKISKDNPNNSYYISCKILNIIRQYENSYFTIYSPIAQTMPYLEIDHCIDLYKKALELNQHDGSFNHNLAWLYFFRKNYTAALYNINIAMGKSCRVSAYYVSAGIMYDYLGDQHKAMKAYSKAIYLSPDMLDSKFWKDIETNKPKYPSIIINEIIAKLGESKDPIDLAKKAKLYIYSNNIDKAKKILIYITQSLPNLSHPWHNLGYLYHKENDAQNMIECYNNSLLVASFYYETCLKLAQYYEEKGERVQSIQNYKATLRYWNCMPTEHSQHCQKIYFVDGIRNDLIPEGLLLYINPCVDKIVIENKINRMTKEMSSSITNH